SLLFFFFSSRRRHTSCYRDWSSDVCSSDLSGARPIHRKFGLGGCAECCKALAPHDLRATPPAPPACATGGNRGKAVPEEKRGQRDRKSVVEGKRGEWEGGRDSGGKSGQWAG